MSRAERRVPVTIAVVLGCICALVLLAMGLIVKRGTERSESGKADDVFAALLRTAKREVDETVSELQKSSEAIIVIEDSGVWYVVKRGNVTMSSDSRHDDASHLATLQGIRKKLPLLPCIASNGGRG